MIFPKEFLVRIEAVLKYRSLITQYAKERSLLPSLVAGLIAQESGGNATVVSVAGAVGLMQIMPDTYIPGRPTKAELLNPDFNIRYGCRLLSDLRTRHRTQAGMLAGYFGAVDSMGRPTTATDATGANGWDYVRLVEANALEYRDIDCDTGINADPDFQIYAPNSGEWREACINLLGVCNDALQTGRRMKERANSISMELADIWGDR